MHIPLAPPPQRDPRPFLKLLHVPPGPALEVMSLVSRLLPFRLHYIEGRTLPCRQPIASCDHCARGNYTRWGAYAAVWPRVANKPALLLVTLGAWENSLDLQGADGELRGKVLECQRLGKTRNSPLRIRVFDPMGAWQRMSRMPDVDLPGSLARMWGIADLHLDATKLPAMPDCSSKPHKED